MDKKTQIATSLALGGGTVAIGFKDNISLIIICVTIIFVAIVIAVIFIRCKAKINVDIALTHKKSVPTELPLTDRDN